MSRWLWAAMINRHRPREHRAYDIELLTAIFSPDDAAAVDRAWALYFLQTKQQAAG